MAIEKIARIHSAASSAASVQKTQSQDKTLQNQIASKQQYLKQVASDADMTATEKEQKRREIQKEIDELNRKLKEEQEEAKTKEATAKEAKQQAQEEAIQKEELQKQLNPPESEKNINVSDQKEVRTDMPVKDIQEMLSADYTIQKEIMKEQVDAARESAIQVLKSEIRQDQMHGADTTKKEADLKILQEKENFWTEQPQQTQQKQQQETNQTQAKVSSAVHSNAKVVIDQI